MDRRNFILASLAAAGHSKVLSQDGVRKERGQVVVPIPASRMIDFEKLGGVGDGNPETGEGTDNSRSFALAELMARQGYGVKFKPGAIYKTTEQINAHNMSWLGDLNNKPMIFGWFNKRGLKIIGPSKSADRISISIIGIIFHRCGPFAEHGIVIDNANGFYFNGVVTSIPGAQGGAIGISPFYPATRPSKNCIIVADINNSGDFGVQLGSVSGAEISLNAKNCYREVIGIEPVVYGVVRLDSRNIIGDRVFLYNEKLSNGDYILYFNGSGNSGDLVPASHYRVTNNDDGSISLYDRPYSGKSPVKLNLSGVTGVHLFAKAAVVENILIKHARIIDDDAVKPSLFASTTGYVIFTGSSGGVIKNIAINKIYIEGNKSHKNVNSIGIYVQGVKNLTIENVKIRGCDQSILVGNGWLNGLFDEKGGKILIGRGYETILSRNIIIKSPDFSGYRCSGLTMGSDAGVVEDKKK